MLYYSMCFSLPGKSKNNQYLYCLALLYKTLKGSGTIRAGDDFVVMTDAETIEVFKTFTCMRGAKFVVVEEQPKTVREMMTYKYKFATLAKLPDGVSVTYLDADMLAVRPLRLQLPDDSLAVFPEGKPEDTNYCGDRPLSNPCGFTAGFFAYRLGPNVRRMFSSILEEMGKEDKGFYTLDQPYFNHAISALKVAPDGTLTGDAICLPADFVSFNGHNNPGATLLNFCGEPGDDAFHYVKMINWFLSRAS